MAYYLSSRYKKYDTGGAFGMLGQGTMQAIGSAAGPVGQAIVGISQGLGNAIDSMNQPDKYGRTSLVGDLASGTLKGGLFGAVGAAIDWKKANRKADTIKAGYEMTDRNMQSERSAAVLGQNPSLIYGNQGAGYYAAGGKLAANYLSSMMRPVGGSVTPMSHDTVQVNGPSHEQGGVELPEQGAEVEGGETMHNDFVFSDRLGFADEHKRIAKAIGKIEDKGAMTPERTNAIQRLEERQENLKLSQEYFKQIMHGASA